MITRTWERRKKKEFSLYVLTQEVVIKEEKDSPPCATDCDLWTQCKHIVLQHNMGDCLKEEDIKDLSDLGFLFCFV